MGSQLGKRPELGLRLYYAPGSCSLAPHVALEEAGAAFETERVHLAGNQQRSPQYLAINPRGRVPTLIIDGAAITENIAVLTCIARLFPEARLLPDGSPLALGRAYEMMSWLTTTVQVSVSQIFRPDRFTIDAPARIVLERDGRVNVAAHYALIEDGLEGPWALGEAYSVLDPLLLVFWRWGQRLGMDTEGWPRWAAHTARLTERPAVIRALAQESQ